SITIYGQNDFEGISSYPYGVGNRDLIASFGTNYQSHAGRYVTQINGGDGRLVTAMIPEIFATYHTSQNASLYDCHIIATPTNGDMNIILPRLTNSYLGEAWQLPPSQAIFTSNTLKFSIYHFGTNSANAVHVFTTNHDVIWCGPAATTNLSVPYGSAVRLITDGVTIWGEGGGEYLTAGPSGPRDGSLLTGVAAALPAFALTNADANNRSLAGNLQVTTLSSSNAGAGTGWSVVTGPNSGAAIETGGSANTNVHRFNAEAGQTLGTIFSWSSNDTSLGNMDLSGNFSTAGAVTGKGLINNGPATLNYAFTPGPSGVGGFFSQTNYELNVASYTSYSYVVSNILGAATNWIVSTNGTAAGTTNTWYYGYTAFWECKTNLANCGSRILNGGRFGYNLNGANTSVGVDSGANGGPAGGVSIGGSVTTVGNAVTVTGSGTNLVNFIAKVSVLAW
ncbi:MAG TPA: hypothetical protein VHB20_04855, partial [Verrucomicrobiae bacterium]|nr:hypothetical protein [Verrucomicrobiae bacterium]